MERSKTLVTFSAEIASALGEKLRRSGSPYTASTLVDLIAGVLAAPAGRTWPELVVSNPDVDLRQALLGLESQIAALQTDPEIEKRAATPERVRTVREWMREQGLDAFLIPRADEHQGEYVPDRARRLAWLTGFTGSAGFAVLMRDRAALFTDGRYTIQARSEVDPTLFELPASSTSAQDWLAAIISEGQRVAYDPWLLSAAERDRYAEVTSRAGAQLVALSKNPIDLAWGLRQPCAPIAPIAAHPLHYSGKSSEVKRRELALALAQEAVVLTQPDSIAWLLNLRGGDLPHTPVALAFAILRQDASVLLFVDRRKLLPGLATHLGSAVTIEDPEAFGPALDALSGAKVRVDPALTAAWIVDRLVRAGAEVCSGSDPCVLPKACKNDVELEGARRAHRRDAVAMQRFLDWLMSAAPAGTVDEIVAAERLEAFRRDDPMFRDLSFPTISGSGPNGAIVHYRVTSETCRKLEPGTFYLVDSGAQYPDGTTDVTRTIAIGAPTEEMRDRYTRVLKGHIALATARFPRGTSGVQLDALARLPLWEAGLDYDHGTGHGVGSFLSVHEGPQRISKHLLAQPLFPGMIVSNEPGFYKEGSFGIRIENLLAVRTCAQMGRDLPGAEREMLCFEMLTHVPIDRTPIVWSMLNEAEREWLELYEIACAGILARQPEASSG